jgi:hypothetical protein
MKLFNRCRHDGVAVARSHGTRGPGLTFTRVLYVCTHCGKARYADRPGHWTLDAIRSQTGTANEWAAVS